MRVTIFDYQAGNIHSLAKAVAAAGGDPIVEPDPSRLAESQVVVLPGAGAFGPAAARLAPGLGRLREAIRGGLPCLGVCLGMHLLFERSDEGEGEGEGEGLGIFAGPITRLRAERIPQIGWNDLEEVSNPIVLESGLRQAYYANSYVARPERPELVGGWSCYQSDRFPAVVAAGRTLGVQFHPEKSSTAGVSLIRAFLERSRS